MSSLVDFETFTDTVCNDHLGSLLPVVEQVSCAISCRSHKRSEWRGIARKAGFVEVVRGHLHKSAEMGSRHSRSSSSLLLARDKSALEQLVTSTKSNEVSRQRSGELLDDGECRGLACWIGAVR